MPIPSRPGLALLLLLCTLVLPGCVATMRGAPKPIITEEDMGASFDPKAQLDILVDGDLTPETRNEAMRKMLAFIDIRYSTFRHDVVANGRHSGAIAGGVTLATDIAATLTDSLGVKDNWIALSALAQGGEAIYDKEYLFQRSLDALVSQMDASRKAKLVEIRKSMLLGIDEYPGEVAVSDVFDYYYAGTLDGAIAHTQQTASESESKSSKQLRTLTTQSAEQISATVSGNGRIRQFVEDLDSGRFEDLQTFLATNGIPIERGTNEAEAAYRVRLRKALNKLHHDSYPNKFEDMVNAMAAGGFTVPELPTEDEE